MNQNRIYKINNIPISPKPVIYWMQRDQRVQDNWALLYAQEQAIKNNVPFIVVFCLVPEFLDATIRQYDFMLKGLEEVEQSLMKFNIPFVLLTGSPSKKIPAFIKEADSGLLVTDFNPLKIIAKWKKEIREKINIAFHEVDAHNIIPCRIASPKLEFAAYTLRPKINKMLANYLDDFPKVKKMKASSFDTNSINWRKVRQTLKIDFSVKPVEWLLSGEKQAGKILDRFLNENLEYYSKLRNDPNKNAVSNLSPYLHFGHVSAQRIALETFKIIEHEEPKKAFLEELIVRRELADNFCFYNENYDSFEGFHSWAKQTLNEHRNDQREFVYSLQEFEKAKTHDDLWNAAQLEMVETGKMHGFMRMYWAKKILEWSATPENAMNAAIYLNDKYELDGRDPNGYTGIAWSIGGVHDRAWGERPVFGKVRYMNYNGCRRKFDVESYINSQQQLF